MPRTAIKMDHNTHSGRGLCAESKVQCQGVGIHNQIDRVCAEDKKLLLKPLSFASTCYALDWFLCAW